MNYDDYIRSPAWTELRNRCLLLAGHRCTFCSSKATTAHHHTYPRYFEDDSLKNLQAVCQPCHTKLHQAKKEKALKLTVVNSQDHPFQLIPGTDAQGVLMPYGCFFSVESFVYFALKFDPKDPIFEWACRIIKTEAENYLAENAGRNKIRPDQMMYEDSGVKEVIYIYSVFKESASKKVGIWRAHLLDRSKADSVTESQRRLIKAYDDFAYDSAPFWDAAIAKALMPKDQTMLNSSGYGNAIALPLQKLGELQLMTQGFIAELANSVVVLDQEVKSKTVDFDELMTATKALELKGIDPSSLSKWPWNNQNAEQKLGEKAKKIFGPTTKKQTQRLSGNSMPRMVSVRPYRQWLDAMAALDADGGGKTALLAS